MAFDHEGLKVYQLAIRFLKEADEMAQSQPRGRGYLADQLRRASLGIVLNIAEGAGKYSGPDKASFYARSLGSVTESAAILDVFHGLGFAEQKRCRSAKVSLERIGQMLTKLIKSCRRRGVLPPEPFPEPEPGL